MTDTKITAKKDTGLAKVDEKWFRDTAKLGVETIETSDLPIPRLSLIQKTTDPKTLKDGTIAKVGKFYYTATREEADIFYCHLLVVRTYMATTYDTRGNSEADQIKEKVWEFFGVRATDLKPFILTCRGISAGGARNFVATVLASKKGMFTYNMALEAKNIESKMGNFYTIVFRDKGFMEDANKLMVLYELAEKYKDRMTSQGITEEELDTEEVIKNEVKETQKEEVETEPVVEESEEDVQGTVPF